MSDESERLRQRMSAVATHRNTTFVWQDFVANPTNPDAAVLATCGHDDISISDADLADLEAARDNLDEPLRSLFDRLLTMARVRQENLIAINNVDVLSMGCDCLSRTIPTRWGLKPTARLGERSAPFDLSVTTPEGVERLLSEGFDRLTDPALLTYSDEHCIPLNSEMGTTFNHEVGPDYAADDFARLRTTYEPRIATINRVITSDTPLLMVVHIPDFFSAQPGHLDLFQRVFTGVVERRTAPASMVVINTFQPGSPDATPPVADITTGSFQWWNVQLPWDGYVWHRVDHFVSPAGIAFEHSLAGRLRQEAVPLQTAQNVPSATE